MPLRVQTYTLRGCSRVDIRREVTELFLLEEPGTGRGEDSSKYIYTVESIDGYAIRLQRPARFNKGFDFTVTVEGLYFRRTRRYNNPSHDD
ncbi:MAG: hypothetical protein LBV70_05220, partial [Candidatus Adiutrix sp.]|nr:hypothetical protein [Candidatus Adiutrix sp.]